MDCFVVDVEADGGLLGRPFALGFLGARVAGSFIFFVAEGSFAPGAGFDGGLSFSRMLLTPEISASISPSAFGTD